MKPKQPRIGISACIFHADPKRPIFKGKTLLYLEESMAQFVMRGGGLPYLVPRWGEVPVDDFVEDLDGLLLHGGSDVAPTSYGETPIEQGKWPGDPIRDRYEIDLYNAFVQGQKPVFGICRGLQVINIAGGGTLYQDTITQRPGAMLHRDWHVYDQLHHGITFTESGGLLARLYGEALGTVNSVHHQAIKDVAPNLTVEAKADGDHIVEAIRWGALGAKQRPWVLGVQWHPEFHRTHDGHLDPMVLMHTFIEAAQYGMEQMR